MKVSGMKHCFLCRYPESILPEFSKAERIATEVALSLNKSHQNRQEDSVSELEKGAFVARNLYESSYISRTRAEFRSSIPEAVNTADIVASKIPHVIVHGRRDFRGLNWNEQRSKALIRDRFRCQNCGMSDSEHRERDDMFPPNAGLHVHHIVPFRTFDRAEKANRVDNLVTLCFECHQEVE